MSQSDRLLDLMSSQVTEGLEAQELLELEQLAAEHHEISLEELELAAAAVDLALDARQGASHESMPPSLRDAVLAQAASALPAAPSPSSTSSHAADVVPLESARQERSAPSLANWIGWAVAAALVIFVLFFRPAAPPAPVPSKTLAEQREELLSTPDVVQVAWARPEIEGYENVTGDVVWSDARQAGFMRLSGLPTNVGTGKQYQLWIVDPDVDQHPVDGGVFDMPGQSGDVLIPIDSKLAVDDPTVFAITLEKQGGVVVSGGPLLVVAAVEA